MAELGEECNDGEISSIRIIQFDFSIHITKIAQAVISTYIFANSRKDSTRLRRELLDKLDMKKALVWIRVPLGVGRTTKI